MRIGMAVRMSPGDGGWPVVEAEVVAAEAAGFDLVVIEDVFMEAGPGDRRGYLESVAAAGAIARASSRIEFGHSMFNGPYRSPALVAQIATTLDEISGGRYILGLGAGNTTDDDYAAAGLPRDHRFSRCAEGVEIIHGLLKTGKADLAGKYQSATGAELVRRGPRPQGPPIVIAALKPKMMRLAARFADEWNGFVSAQQGVETFRPLTDELDAACRDVGRVPGSLRRSLDVLVDTQSIVPEATRAPYGEFLFHGTAGEIADQLLALQEIGISEVRCYLTPQPDSNVKPAAIAAMSEIVDLVHSG